MGFKNEETKRNYYNKKNEAVKKWRRNTKQKIVESMGGCCQICKYNKTNSALELHHIDPSKKEISFGAIRANPKSIHIIAKELEKCILLCSNCHKEIHDGTSDLPEDYAKLNINILMPIKEVKIHIPKPRPRKIKISDEEIKKLIEENKNNYSKVGRILGVSDNAVRKRLKKIGYIN